MIDLHHQQPDLLLTQFAFADVDDRCHDIGLALEDDRIQSDLDRNVLACLGPRTKIPTAPDWPGRWRICEASTEANVSRAEVIWEEIFDLMSDELIGGVA